MRLHELFNEGADDPATLIDQVYVRTDDALLESITEGMVINGRYAGNIRIDHDTYSGGLAQTHAHVYGRHGDELGVVNANGSASHGTRMRLSKPDAEALRKRDFKIRKDRWVEWLVIGRIGSNGIRILFG